MTDDTPLRPDTSSPDTGSRPLGTRFGFLLTSSSLSNLADGVLKVGLPLAALAHTDSPTLVAGVTIALSLPWLLLALPAGALADRVDRRAAMLGANVARAALLSLLAVLLSVDAGSIWVLYAVAFCVGAAETVHDTAAQSILPQVVPRDRLSRANGRLHAVELTANQFAGPPLGGLLVALGAVAAFAAPAALWLVAVGALLLVRGRFRVGRATRTSLRADITEGLRFLWRHRLLRTFAVLVGSSNLATSATFAILVLFAVGPGSPMGLSEPGYGLLLTSTAAGSLLGALTADRVEGVLGRAWALRLSVLGSASCSAFPR
ncbi:MFS transporter [Nocardiopsis lucentensis]|uniref:MFS transporter n=1 Tax=Nocardiopsis lucentensis TaxID=53441 RepID=UPI0003492780